MSKLTMNQLIGYLVANDDDVAEAFGCTSEEVSAAAAALGRAMVALETLAESGSVLARQTLDEM